MSDEKKIKVRRVLKNDNDVMSTSTGGRASCRAPANGYVIQFDDPHAIPVFVRDEDLKDAEAMRLSKGRSIAVDARSWEGS